ncbi:MAG: hypothetical protein ACYTFY_10125 [Planctomycetota bacterium]
MFRKLVVGALCLTIMGAVSLKANDTAEIADMQARVATLEAKLMAPAGGGDAESLTSLRKKGAVKIGGNVEIDLIFTRRSDANENSDHIDRTQYALATGDLDIRVDAGTDTYLFIKLDLGDTGVDGDLTEEIQFVWENVRGSNWQLMLGKAEVPFGQDKTNLITDGYVNGAPIVVTGGEAASDSVNSNGGGNGDAEEDFHESQAIMANWVGEVDNRWGVAATYNYKELGTFELSAFQNLDDMHEDRS